MAAQEPTQAAGAPRVPLGGDYWQCDPGVPLWGFADAMLTSWPSISASIRRASITWPVGYGQSTGR
jgi:hypothetical protein